MTTPKSGWQRPLHLGVRQRRGWLSGVAERPPIGSRGSARGHAQGTRSRLLQDVPVGGNGGRELVGLDALLDEEHPDAIWLLERRGARHMLEAAHNRARELAQNA